jgi:hypothetical protein
MALRTPRYHVTGLSIAEQVPERSRGRKGEEPWVLPIVSCSDVPRGAFRGSCPLLATLVAHYLAQDYPCPTIESLTGPT